MMSGAIFLLEFSIPLKKDFDCIQFMNRSYLEYIFYGEVILLQQRIDAINSRDVMADRFISNSTGNVHILFEVLNQNEYPSFLNNSIQYVLKNVPISDGYLVC